MTPAEELRAAAKKLRKMSDDLGEWWYDDNITHVRDRNGDLVTAAGPEDGRWMALLGPQLAEPLAGWPEAEAACQEAIAEDVGSQKLARILDIIAGRETGAELTTSFDVGPQALAFARAILGSPA
jgi:hypothetical protein